MDDINTLANVIQPDDLPDPYRSIAYLIGVQNTLKLANIYQGTGMYLPKLDGFLRKFRDENIRKEFNGGNYKELALKYKLTESWVREIINNGRNLDQISIFDLEDSKEISQVVE